MTIQINIVNRKYGLIFKCFLSVDRTASGLYMLDYASSRISVDDENTNTDSEIETITIVIALLNIGLLIVLIYNISEGRKEKALLEKAGRRAERLKVNSKKA